ncbi:MAG: hypothetical protein KF682_02990 [Nitrospira sp.]|nr:hypothetical protein [Nitrospira sp.]
MLSALALVLHSGFEFKDNRRESRTAINRGKHRTTKNGYLDQGKTV